MNFRFHPTPLLAALASGQLLGCEMGSEDRSDPNPSGGGQGRFAEKRSPGGAFLAAFAQTDRFWRGFPVHVRIAPDERSVYFLRAEAREKEQALFRLDIESAQETLVLTSEALLGGEEETLSPEERARRERLRLRSRGITSYQLSPDGNRLLIPLSGRLFLADLQGAARELAPEGGSIVDARFSPDGRSIGCVRDGNVFVIDVTSGAQRRLTDRTQAHTTHGLAEFVAQEEMGRSRGWWWSPDSAHIVFQSTDTSAVERLHIFDPSRPEKAPLEWAYPRAGKNNADVWLSVVSVRGGAPQRIRWDRERYPYLASVTWDEHGPLTLLVQNRSQQEALLLTADPSTGTTEVLFRDADEAWLNLDQSVPRWLSAEGGFLFSSEVGGHYRLWLHDRSGARVRALTDASFGYRSLLRVDHERGEAWVLASGEPTETHVHRIAIDGSEAPVSLSEAPGEHSAVVGKRAAVFVHRYHDRDGSHGTTVRRRDGTEVARLADRAETPSLTPNLAFESVGPRELRTVLVRPRDLRPGLKYPVILHVYGGPHVRYVTANARRYLIEQWFAEHNFVVAMIDGRGTPGRGRNWERAIRGDLLGPGLADQVEALRALGARHDYLDLDRVGIWGWSFGGTFAATAVLRRPDVFRAAIAGAPVTDWRDYDTHYTERYLGMPEEAGEQGVYHRNSVMAHAVSAPADQHRPLLLVHGTADDNVYFSHALKLQDALLRVGRPAELMTLKGMTHMVSDPELLRRMHERWVQFFEAHLRRPAKSPYR